MAISPEIRLKRYLCYTNEANIYYPGCRFLNKRYTRESVPSLTDLLNDEKSDYIFNLIKTIHEEHNSCHPDALLFVLSELSRDKKLRPKSLKLAEDLCDKTESFFTFLKFSLENSPKIGFGRSFRKFVRNWYTRKDYLQLAEIVAETKRYKGWCHSDFMKLAHVKCTEPAKNASFKYAVHGIEAVKKDFGEIEEAKKVVEYLSTVETYRRKEDGAEVAAKIDSYMLGFYHINCVLHADKRIWLALLKQMPVQQVLNHFQFMSKKKMFRNNRTWDFVFVDSIVEALTKPYANRTGVTPNRVFIELMNYENAGKVKMELATRLKHTAKKPPIIHSEISNAFLTLMDFCFEGVESSGKKIMIAIEQSQEMVKRRCFSSRYITLVEAAVFVAYYFLKTEASLNIFHFNCNGITPLAWTKEANLKQLIESQKGESIPEASGPKSKGDEHITNWLKENASKGGSDEIDVCIIIKSYLDNNSLHALVSGTFGTTKKMKFIVSDLCGIPKNCKPPDKKNLFVTSGFDEKLLEAMRMFISDVY